MSEGSHLAWFVPTHIQSPCLVANRITDPFAESRSFLFSENTRNKVLIIIIKCFILPPFL